MLVDNLLNNAPETTSPMPVELATAEELQNLHAHLEKLLTHHKPALAEIEAMEDADKLMNWIERCEAGSAVAEKKLLRDGTAMLENIKGKLNLALEEQQRIEEESPTVASNNRGREAERFAKASRRTNDALSTLNNLTDSSKS